MEYLYSVTCTYDGDKSPHWTGRFNNALDAVDTYNKFVDWGLANEYSTVNLYTPAGKCYTKVFYRSGMVAVK